MLPVTPRSTDGQALQQSPPQGERHYPKRSGNLGTAFVSLLVPCAPTCAWLPRTPACWMILHRPSSVWWLSTAGRTIGNMVRCLHDCCWPLFLGQSVHVPGRLTRPCRVSCPGTRPLQAGGTPLTIAATSSPQGLLRRGSEGPGTSCPALFLYSFPPSS